MEGREKEEREVEGREKDGERRDVPLYSTLASVHTWESVSLLGREGWLLFCLLTREIRQGLDSGGGLHCRCNVISTRVEPWDKQSLT